MTQLTLTADQQAAYQDIVQFLNDPNERVFVLSGYSGTGKSTLVIHVIKEMAKLLKMQRLVNPGQEPMELVLTATTNKAAESLAFITGHEVRTIQSVLGLRVHKDFKSGNSSLMATSRSQEINNSLVVVDEFSYVDSNLLSLISRYTANPTCKVLYVGDPAQITPVKCSDVPVLSANFPTTYLTEVVRQAEGNPIIDLSAKFRDMVNTGKAFQFTPDGVAIRHVEGNDFDTAVIDEFTHSDWHDRKSKLLAWTNKAVIRYNQNINNIVKGTPKFSPGDYAVCNSFIHTRSCQFKTDQSVLISDISPTTEKGIDGNIFRFEGGASAFMPNCNDEKKKLLRKLKAENNISEVAYIEQNWIDLRAAYSCTVNKSQGSTYDKVFIDLDDISKCRSQNQLARMLYVAVSRARHEVVFTGDLV